MAKGDWRDKTSPSHRRWRSIIVLDFGAGDQFSFGRLDELGCIRWRAVSALKRALRDVLKPRKGVRELADRTDAAKFWAIPGIGEEAICVWMTILESKKRDSNAWYGEEVKLQTSYARVRKKLHKRRR